MNPSTDDGRDGAQDPEQAKDRDTPEVGLVGDEDLPEDLQPSDENPLAQDPEREDDEREDDEGDAKVEGMPDIGSPGSPA